MGEHRATLVEYKDLGEQDDIYHPGETRMVMEVVFELEDGAKQFAWLKQSLHPSSNFYAMATALLGANPPDDLDTDEFMEELLHRSCLVTIDHYTRQQGKRSGKQASKIVDFRILPKAGQAARHRAPVAPVVPTSRPSDITDDDIPF